MWGNSSYTTDLILVIVDDLNSVKERIKLSAEQGSVLNHCDIASVCIYLAWKEAQWDFYAVYPVRFVVCTCLAPEIFITGIVLQSFSASAPGTIMHAKQIKAFSNQRGRNLFAATKHRTTKYSKHSKAVTLDSILFLHFFQNCMQHYCITMGFFCILKLVRYKMDS